MAHKTARRKFRPPLKEGASLPCSQASSASGLVEASQERGREGSQSWLSQLTITDSSPSCSKPELAAKFSTEKPKHGAVGSKDGIFSLDDSLCSISMENENLNNSGGNVQDGLSGSNTAISPESSLHQETQTHTVLSFCSEAGTPAVASELQKELSAAVGKFQIIEYTQAEPTDDIVVDCSDSEHKVLKQGNLKKPESRFQHKNIPATRKYDYSKILPRFGPQKPKKGSKNSIKSRTEKRVTLDLVVNQHHFTSTSVVSGMDHHDKTDKGDLSVYDYQPTPQWEGDCETSELNNSNWITKRTKEERLAVDREVLKIIAKTREEIRILRESYAARKASRKTSLQFTESSKSHTAFKVPQQGFRRSCRAKPSLVMREGYGSSVLQKDPGTAHYKYKYAVLQKEE